MNERLMNICLYNLLVFMCTKNEGCPIILDNPFYYRSVLSRLFGNIDDGNTHHNTHLPFLPIPAESCFNLIRLIRNPWIPE